MPLSVLVSVAASVPMYQRTPVGDARADVILLERCKGSVELLDFTSKAVNKTEDSDSVMAILISMKPYPKDCWDGSWSYRSHVLPLHPSFL